MAIPARSILHGFRRINFGKRMASTWADQHLSNVQPSRWRPALWSSVIGGGVFLYAAVETNYDTDRIIDNLRKSRRITTWFQDMSNAVPSDQELARFRRNELMKSAQGVVNYISSFSSGLQRISVMVAEAYISMPESQRTCLGLVAIQGLIYAAWKVPRFQGFMIRSFLHYPLSGRSYTLLTSTFSHPTFTHLAFNSLALFSIGSATHQYFMKSVRTNLDPDADPSAPSLPESTSRYHFVAFFLMAGIFASLVSHTRTITLLKRLPLQNLSRNTTTTSKVHNLDLVRPSTGASGAVYAAVVITALAFPDASVTTMLFPFVSFPINYGVMGMVTLDVIGLIRGWRYFDHTAHLGGALFGYLYYIYGCDAFDSLRLEMEEIEQNESKSTKTKN